MTARARRGSTRRARPTRAWDDGARRALRARRLRPLRRRILDPALPRRRRRDRHLGGAAQPPRGRHPRHLERARRPGSRRRDRRGRGAGPARSPTRSTMSGCWRWSFSRSAARRSSTRWRRASTIAATGRSRARAPRSSRTISARSAACRSARPTSPRRASRCATWSAPRRTAGRDILADPAAHLHLYGKERGPPRPQDGPRHPAAR